MYKSAFFLLFFFCSLNILSQNISEKRFSNTNVEVIKINGKDIFNIRLVSEERNDILIKSSIEGEYKDNLLIKTAIEKGVLNVSVIYQPTFKAPNDKLSAHKVNAIDLMLYVPQSITIDIESDIANIFTTGVFKSLTISTLHGNCSLAQFNGDLTVKTLDGSVDLETNYSKISATSKNGQVIRHVTDIGHNKHFITTINGSITITKTKN